MVVIECLVLEILIPGPKAFQPDMAIGAVYREMVGNEELQPALLNVFTVADVYMIALLGFPHTPEVFLNP
jgi:hypothetical protein